MKKFLLPFFILAVVVIGGVLVSPVIYPNWKSDQYALVKILVAVIGVAPVVLVAGIEYFDKFLDFFKKHFPSKTPDQSGLPKLPKQKTIPNVQPLPVGSTMPHLPNRDFVARENDLKTLAEHLLFKPERDKATLVPPLIVAGMGGLGKTQLAVEFCHRYGASFEGVHWLNAGRGADLPAQIAACGTMMGITPFPEAQEAQVQATLREWQKSRRRLVVLDNVDEEAVLRDWLPQLTCTRVLVTARQAEWPSYLGVTAHQPGLFNPAESRKLLRTLAPRLTSATDGELDEVSGYLGHLPLALTLAGSYLGDCQHVSPADYLGALKAEASALDHKSLLDWVEGLPTKHETSLAGTFGVAWEQLGRDGERGRLAQEAFRKAGYLAAGVPIPVGLLLRAVAQVKEQADEAQRALDRVVSLGLLSRSGEDYLLHPLLKHFAASLAKAVSGEENERLLMPLARVFANAGNGANNSGLPANYLPVLPHIESLLALPGAEKAAWAAGLWNVSGRYEDMVAYYAAARKRLETALAIAEPIYGPDHPQVATYVSNLGGVLQALGDLQAARSCYERALKIGEAAYGENHPIVAIRVNNLGNVLKALGELREARACYERALKIDEKIYGPEHPEVARDVNNLGLVLKILGELQAAKECYERALNIFEEKLGTDHPDTKTTHDNLDSLLRQMGEEPTPSPE